MGSEMCIRDSDTEDPVYGALTVREGREGLVTKLKNVDEVFHTPNWVCPIPGRDGTWLRLQDMPMCGHWTNMTHINLFWYCGPGAECGGAPPRCWAIG